MYCVWLSNSCTCRLDPRCGRSMADLEAFLTDPRLRLWVRSCSLLAGPGFERFYTFVKVLSFFRSPYWWFSFHDSCTEVLVAFHLILAILSACISSGGQPSRVPARPPRQSLILTTGRARPQRLGHGAPLSDHCLLVVECCACLRRCYDSFGGDSFLCAFIVVFIVVFYKFRHARQKHYGEGCAWRPKATALRAEQQRVALSSCS